MKYKNPEDYCTEMLGKWYDTTNQMSKEKRQKYYSQIAQINSIWFEKIPVKVVFQEKDPYQSYKEMKETVRKEGFLRVFSKGSSPKGMTDNDNLKGRAIHDWYGHLERDCSFSMKGEFLKYNHVKCRYPDHLHGLLFAEIVGQRAAASYYENGFTDNRFEQKAINTSPYIQKLTENLLTC